MCPRLRFLAVFMVATKSWWVCLSCLLSEGASYNFSALNNKFGDEFSSEQAYLRFLVLQFLSFWMRFHYFCLLRYFFSLTLYKNSLSNSPRSWLRQLLQCSWLLVAAETCRLRRCLHSWCKYVLFLWLFAHGFPRIASLTSHVFFFHYLTFLRFGMHLD